MQVEYAFADDFIVFAKDVESLHTNLNLGNQHCKKEIWKYIYTKLKVYGNIKNDIKMEIQLDGME